MSWRETIAGLAYAMGVVLVVGVFSLLVVMGSGYAIAWIFGGG